MILLPVSDDLPCVLCDRVTAARPGRGGLRDSKETWETLEHRGSR